MADEPQRTRMNIGSHPDFAAFLAPYFGARKMQKLTVDCGAACPNRDGTIGRGGCDYCRVDSFTPITAVAGESIAQQIERSRRFFSRKYSDMGYLAYFQPYTATHAGSDRFLSMLSEALAADGVEGAVIGTRPDCMPQSLLSQLAKIQKFVMVEYGAESANDATLRRVNRCHTWADTADAVERTAAAGIPVGLHLIMGLPGESRADMLRTVDCVNALPVDVVKIHQLQILEGTPLASRYRSGEEGIAPFTLEEYLDLCVEILERLRADIAVDRLVSQAPENMIIAPRWGLKNYQFTNLLNNRLHEKSR